jgi:hypothetical protein
LPTIKSQKMYKYTGTLTHYFNEFDNHDKVLEFDVISDRELNYNEVVDKVCEDYQRVLGLSQKIGSVSYTTEIVLMEAK